MSQGSADAKGSRRHSIASIFEVFRVSAKLGLTSFGGPIAHLGYYLDEYVTRRKWIDEQTYADLVALCQVLPGPASTQLGIAIGVERAGLPGGFAAWIGFTLPSAIAMWAFAVVVRGLDPRYAGFLHGLIVVAVAVVAQAGWSMARKFANRPSTGSITLAASVITLLVPSAFVQVIAIAVGGILGWFLFRKDPVNPVASTHAPYSRSIGLAAWILFAALLFALPAVGPFAQSKWFDMFNGFYRAGALVFGGGHVVLPLLQQVVVPAGWLTNGQFLAGYGAAQAVPGPLFTFSAYLGATIFPSSNGLPGAAVALCAIFLPAFLLIVGALPFWNAFRARSGFQAALKGVNAAVVGILLAALYNPVWVSAILTPIDLALALAAFGLLVLWKLPPWVVVIATAAAAFGISLL
jgi:chromate transporter